MDDEALRAKTNDFRIKRELLLKQLYHHQFIGNPTARVWDMTIIAKDLLPEFEISRIELKQIYAYLVGEGLIAHDLPRSPNISNNSSFSHILGPFFPDTWLTPKGIKEVEKPINAEKVATKQQAATSNEIRPAWFPRKQETLELWARAWASMEYLRKEFARAHEERGGRPIPNNTEYKRHLFDVIEWDTSIRTITNVKKAGKENWLKDYMP